jgi:uncharacterized Zn-binding protein involved in type VI secretion
MKVTRVGDLGAGVCRAGHPGKKVGVPVDYVTTHISGAKTVFANGAPMAVLGTIGTTSCGHTTMAVSGSQTVFIEGIPAHRVGDVGVINEGSGEHVVISGSADVSDE